MYSRIFRNKPHDAISLPFNLTHLTRHCTARETKAAAM